MRLTKLAIDRAAPPPAGVKQRFLRDDVCRGLGVRITQDGSRSFIFEYWSKGRSHRLTIGRWPDLNIPQARHKATEYRAAIARGEDPAQERIKARHEATFAQLTERYLNDYARPHKKPRSVQDDEYCLSLIPRDWHNRRLSEISRDTVSRLHLRIGEHHGRYSANHVIRLLRSMFNRAIDWRMLNGANPAQRLRLFREERRERYLSPEELQRVNAALLVEPDWRWKAFFPLSIMLGTRKGELLAARWETSTWHMEPGGSLTPRRTSLTCYRFPPLRSRSWNCYPAGTSPPQKGPRPRGGYSPPLIALRDTLPALSVPGSASATALACLMSGSTTCGTRSRPGWPRRDSVCR